jgi:hypothetical protein
LDAGTRNSFEELPRCLWALFELSLGSPWNIFGTKFWKNLKKIRRNQSSKWGSLEAPAGTKKRLKPLQNPLIWVVVKKF